MKLVILEAGFQIKHLPKGAGASLTTPVLRPLAARAKAHQQIWARRRAGSCPRRQDLLLLAGHHSAPAYRELRGYMGDIARHGSRPTAGAVLLAAAVAQGTGIVSGPGKASLRPHKATDRWRTDEDGRDCCQQCDTNRLEQEIGNA